MQVTIIGGGVIGLCSAYYLQQAGYDVSVIEKNNFAEGCSFGNMGYISPSHFVPLATPGIVSQGIRWMTSSSSPFYIKPQLNLDLLKWGLAFYKKANAKNVEDNAPHLNNLLQLSRELITDLHKQLNADIGLTERGCLMLWKNPRTGDHEKHLADQAEKFGLRTTIYSPGEVQTLEPDAEVDVAGGVLYEDDCHLDPRKLMESLHAYLHKAGVKLQSQTTVDSFETRNGKINAVITNNGKFNCEELVIANGSWMGLLAKKLGINMLMQPGKGYSITYVDLEKNLHYPSILVDDRTATTPINRWLRIGGTMELSGHSDNIMEPRVSAIHSAFHKYYPSMKLPLPNKGNTWFGYRPVTPDGMPYIGRHTKYRNLAFAGGHAMLGVSAATGTGRLVTEIIQQAEPSIEITAFAPGRFR